MKPGELKKTLEDIRRVHVAVVGDFCLDAYWFVDASREEISVETGLGTHPVRRQRYTLGGAGNVVMNLVDLGVGKVTACGVIGADPFGQEMSRLLAAAGVNATGLVVQDADWSTLVYAKPYRGEKELNRIDFGDFNRLDETTTATLLDGVEAALGEADVLIVNEQVSSGIHGSEAFRTRLNALLRKHPGKPILVDSRHYSGAYAHAWHKINDNEAARLCGMPRGAGDLVLRSEAVEAARTLTARWGKPVVVTRGARGCLVAAGDDVSEIPGLLIIGRVDSVGAGDSLLAGLAAATAAGRDPVTAATLGNFVAGVTVQKLFQTGSATPPEVLKIGSDPDYVYRPELAEDLRQARRHGDTEIEVVTAPPDGGRFTHAIFDHDGTISTLRQGWEQVMEPMMIGAILGDRFKDADESLYHRVIQRVRDTIDKTTGIQTLVQMEGLVEMVREFGVVAADRVLDARGYKDLYNRELMERVKERIAKFDRHELGVEDFTMKNAVRLLEGLRRAGVELFLASGTDEPDVKAEAKALGYADLFKGRIYGAVGRADVDAKKVVLDRILGDIGAGNATHVIVFGDGPVEIRETHKRGGYAVGVASDEIRRFGIHVEKRARLIRAGADLIVPDYSQLDALLQVLCLSPR